MLGLAQHLIKALECKIGADFGCGPNGLSKRAQLVRERIASQFAQCQMAVYVGDSRITRPLWELPLSRMRITTAVIEALPYALRDIWHGKEEEDIITLFRWFREYVMEVTSRTTVPTAETKEFGHRYGRLIL